MKQCRHCGRGKANRSRGLCWTCCRTPGVRQQYPSTSKYAKSAIESAIEDFYGTTPQPRYPTKRLPGTAGKVSVLATRAQQGETLWHPHDYPHGLSLA